MGFQSTPGGNTTRESITTITATTAKTVIPANLERNGGLIENRATCPMYLTWGTGAIAAAEPYTRVESLDSIWIPNNFVGAITVLWLGTPAPGSKLVAHELIP
jgi:hypothetical protein